MEIFDNFDPNTMVFLLSRNHKKIHKNFFLNSSGTNTTKTGSFLFKIMTSLLVVPAMILTFKIEN